MKKISCYLFLTVLLCVSCVKEEDVQDPVAPVTQTETPTGVTLPTGVILPKSIIKTDNKGVVSVTNYTYGFDNKIANIDYGWRKLSYVYNNNLITEKRDTNGDSKTDYTYDDKGRLINEALVYRGDLSTLNKTIYTYNPDQTILVQNETNVLPAFGSDIRTYSPEGNLIKTIVTYDSDYSKSIITYTYEYDTSKNIHTNIVGFNKTDLDYSRSKNNPIKFTYVSNTVIKATGVVEPPVTYNFSWEYVYDVTKTYPVEVKEFRDKVLLSTSKINY
jgi:hypothetical protein